jgi:heme/copper-type cytochrome/quinol oxidase subunit 3
MAHDNTLAHATAQAHVEETNTGVDNRKMGFWLFLSSESIFFACLIVGYLVYRHTYNGGPTQHELFKIPLTSVSTFVLLMSSLSVVLAVFTAQQGRAKDAVKWVAATAAMGIIFLGFQVYEFTHFIGEGLSISTSPFGTAFYVLTGFHGTHVAVGVIWLISLLYHGKGGGLGKDKAGDVEVAALYWHFVDIVWIVLFTVVYLMEFAK